VVPALPDDDFLTLRRSIRAAGLLDEILLHEGQVLDGRHRLRACLAEGVEPRYRAFTGPDPRAFILSSLAARHLSPPARALVAARLLHAKWRGDDGELLQLDDARRLLGVSREAVVEGSWVAGRGVAELQRLVEVGGVPVRDAAAVARLPPPEQERVVAVGARAVAAKGRALRRERKERSRRTPSASRARAAAEFQARHFSAATLELLNDLKALAAKFTRFLQTADGQRFLQYNQILATGWVDFGPVRLADRGAGLKKVPASWVAFRQVYRLLVAAARDRAYPAADLRELLSVPGETQLDGDTPPPEPEDDPTQLVEPESL
jgi:hypothetical protein